MSAKIWRLAAADERQTETLAAELKLPLPAAHLLAARGYTAPLIAEKFLRARLSDLSEPERLPNITVAVERLAYALAAHEKIVIFGDYDADGLTSAALLVRFLRALGAEVAAFIPHRLDDGYGLTAPALAKCIEQHQPQLIITVDCGTCSPDAVRSTDVPLIVTDHHDPAGEISPALAVVNPKLGDDPILRQLAGVGVAFKLCHALLKHLRKNNGTTVDLKDFLDLVAIGTVADIVPLTGENRILVRHGLLRLAETKNIGLAALMDVAGLAENPDAWHLGFVLGPRLNAVGRLGNAAKVLELLLTDDTAHAHELAQQLDTANRERQEIERRIVAEAMREIDASFDPARIFGLVVANAGWHPGVVGIVAARLVQRYRRPSIVLAQEADGTCRGSCRSIEEFHLVEHLAQCADLLTRYGGHGLAAGLSLDAKNLPAFQKRFNELAHQTLANVDLRPTLRLDGWLALREANDELHDALERLRPFGQHHSDPVWAVRGARLMGAPRRMAKDTLGLTLTGDGVMLRAVGFGMAQREIPDGPLDIAFHLRRQTWQGNTALQLQLLDFRPTSTE
ncbi:MAG: single-stranded-DNA-specific exonuclease RecJ [Verrucomicrobia bacterium]|nr:MAG: single-stranded-DNA-specific exonuclease RecJ [Verrucomicrobiota bacterium]